MYPIFAALFPDEFSGVEIFHVLGLRPVNIFVVNRPFAVGEICLRNLEGALVDFLRFSYAVPIATFETFVG